MNMRCCSRLTAQSIKSLSIKEHYYNLNENIFSAHNVTLFIWISSVKCWKFSNTVCILNIILSMVITSRWQFDDRFLNWREQCLWCRVRTAKFHYLIQHAWIRSLAGSKYDNLIIRATFQISMNQIPVKPFHFYRILTPTSASSLSR